MLEPIETPYDLLRREEIELPDFIDLGGYHYRDCILVYMVRVWQYLYENRKSIDANRFESVATFESEHQEALFRRADGLGLSTVQAPTAQAAALAIQQEGFEAWRSRQFDHHGRTFIWRPTDEFEWNDRKYAEDIANTFGEAHPLYDAAVEVLNELDPDEARGKNGG